MPRIDDIERRLRRWARWKPSGGAGGLGFATGDMTADRVDGGDGPSATYQDGEEAITDMAVDALDADLKNTVYVMYVHGGGRAHKLRLLGHIAESTLDSRIWMAHRKISNWLSDRRERADHERARVERLQRESARK